MPELSDLRMMLRDRLHKEGALGTTESVICLDVSLLDKLEELETERSAMTGGPKPKPDVRLGATLIGEPSTAEIEIDKEIEDLNQQIRDASVKVTFKALSSVRYQTVLNNHPDANDEGLEPFLNELVSSCFHECRGLDGLKLEVTWDELRAGITYGEWEPISAAVLALNRRKVDVPFSLQSSKRTRLSVVTPEPVSN